MGIDVEALKLREIERDSQFEPIDFGGALASGIDVAQKFQASQAKSQEVAASSKKAAMFQQLIDGGDAAILQKLGSMPEEQQKSIFGGDTNIIQNISQTKEGQLDVWKRISEVEAAFAGDEAPDFRSNVNIAQKAGTITAKDALTFQKPQAGKAGLSNDAKLAIQSAISKKEKEIGRELNKSEVSAAAREEALRLGLGDAATTDFVKSAITAAPITEKPLEREKHELAKTIRQEEAQRRLGDGFTTKKKNVVIAANQLNNAIEGGVFGDQFKNLISAKFMEGLQERLDLGGEKESMVNTLINALASGKITDKKEAERVNRVRKDPEFQALLNNPKFHKTFVALSNLFTAVLRLESGAAITGTDIEDKKNNFGMDSLGTPTSLFIGIGNFFEGLRANVVSTIEQGPNKPAVIAFKKDISKEPLVDPYLLPTRAAQLEKVKEQRLKNTEERRVLEEELRLLNTSKKVVK